MKKNKIEQSFKKKLWKAIKIILFLSVGIFLFWLVYRDMDFSEVIETLPKFNYWWLTLALAVQMLSHVSRAIRWNLLIQPLGYNPRKINTFLSVMIMYLMNFAIPRSGEVSRCGVLSQYEKIPFSKLLGTMILERLFDVIMMFLLAFIVFLSVILARTILIEILVYALFFSLCILV